MTESFDKRHTFAIVGPPADKDNLYDVIDFYKKSERRFSSDRTLLKIFEWMPSYKGTDFGILKSKTGEEVSGFHVMCTVLPEMVGTISPETGIMELAAKKVWQACRVAAENGAELAALGGFSSIAVIGQEEKIADATGIAVTSGNTYTAWLTVEGVERAAEAVGLNLDRATLAVIGASGDIGRGVCAALAGRVGKLILVARNRERLERYASNLARFATAGLSTSTKASEAVGGADIIVAAAISAEPIIKAEDVHPGTIICDVGYPKNVSHEMVKRNDVFIFEGGLARTPFVVDFGYRKKLPAPDILWGCSSEGIILALEGLIKNYSTGRGNITVEKMNEIGAAGLKHGFEPALFYAGDRFLTRDDAGRVGNYLKTELRRAVPGGGGSIV